MIRKSYFSRYLIPAATLSLIACGSSGEEGTDPTPTPTPPPMNDYFRISRLEILSEGEGVDVDSDGDADNNIEVALQTLADGISVGIETALAESSIPFGEDCVPQQPCGDDIMDTVNDTLDSVLSVEALSDQINDPIQAGNINYLQQFEEAGTGVNLNWYQAEFVETGFAPTTVLGQQAGSLDASGGGTFGPGSLTLTTEITTQGRDGETNTTSFYITLYNGKTIVSGYNDNKLTDFITGGAVSIEDLLALMETTINNINDALPTGISEEQIQLIIDTAAGALLPLADVSVDADAELEGFSIGLGGDSSSIDPVE